MDMSRAPLVGGGQTPWDMDAAAMEAARLNRSGAPNGGYGAGGYNSPRRSMVWWRRTRFWMVFGALTFSVIVGVAVRVAVYEINKHQ